MPDVSAEIDRVARERRQTWELTLSDFVEHVQKKRQDGLAPTFAAEFAAWVVKSDAALLVREADLRAKMEADDKISGERGCYKP